MHIELTGHHCEITSALRDHVNEKMEKVSHVFSPISSCHVVLTVEKQVQKAEANISVKGTTLFAVAEDQNMYAAIDALSDKLCRQLLKYKGKHEPNRST